MLRVFENRMLTKIFGSQRVKVTSDYSQLGNEGLYCSPNIIWVIKSKKMRQAGHVARMGQRGRFIQLFVWGTRTKENTRESQEEMEKKNMYHTSLKGITSFPCICLFCSVLPPLPPSAFRAHTCVYVARAKVNVSRRFLPCHVIHDTHISTGYGVTSRVLTYQVT